MQKNKLVESLENEELKLRIIACELNPLTRADGSALFAQGDTCVLASTIGPIEAKLQNIKIDRAHVECVYKPKARLPSIHDKMRQSLIRDTCESAMLTSIYPRSLISIQIQELDDCCGLEACAVNAACLALLISGIPMTCTFAGVHCIIDAAGDLILDPDRLQSKNKQADFLFVFESLEYKLITLHTTGKFTRAQFNSAELMCRSAAKLMFKFYKKILQKFHKKSIADIVEDSNILLSKEEKMET